jgi:DNA-binding TFAR19-related protein (PDSD5 family)
VKIQRVTVNNKKRAFEVRVAARTLAFPFSKAAPCPTASDPVARVLPDDELAREAITYKLSSGAEGTVYVEQVLEYNEDPSYLREQLLYKLTVEARKRVDRTPLSKRELARALRTSAPQLYRLLDQTNTQKSVDQMLRLLQVLECDVDFVVRTRGGRAARGAA